MASKQLKRTAVPVAPPSSIWGDVLGVLALVVVFLVPFFPDEKLIRPKMQMLEFGVFGLLSAAGVRMFLTSHFPFKKERRSAWLAGAVTVWVCVQTVLFFMADEKSLAANEMRRILLGGGAFFAFALPAFERAWVKRILTAWGFSAGLIGLYACLQVSGGIGIFQVPQMARVMGTYGNPIFLAAFLVSSIFVTVAALAAVKTRFVKNLLLGGLAVQGIALYFTQTRAAWVALVVTALVGAILKSGGRKIPKWMVMAGILLCGAFAYQTRGVWQRDQGHLLIWRDTLRMWIENPVKGVGLGAFHVNFPSYAQDDLKSKWPQGQFIINYSHNEYLQQLAETGLVGFASFAAIFLALGLLIKNRTASDPVAFSVLLAILALLIQNFFSVDMRFGISFGSLFILIGLLVSHYFGTEDKGSGDGDPWPASVRFGAAALWGVFMGFVVFPKIMQPYRAQKEVSAAPGFFNERLLDPAKSIQDLEKLAQEYPQEPLVLEKLAYVYAKEMKTSDDKINQPMAEAALTTYEKLIRVDSNRVSAVNNMANINYTLGRHDEAIALWEKCVAIDPNFVDAHLNLGKTLYVRGKLKESAAHLEKVLQLQPGNAEAIVYLKRMVE